MSQTLLERASGVVAASNGRTSPPARRPSTLGAVDERAPRTRSLSGSVARTPRHHHHCSRRLLAHRRRRIVPRQPRGRVTSDRPAALCLPCRRRRVRSSIGVGTLLGVVACGDSSPVDGASLLEVLEVRAGVEAAGRLSAPGPNSIRLRREIEVFLCSTTRMRRSSKRKRRSTSSVSCGASEPCLRRAINASISDGLVESGGSCSLIEAAF